MTAAEDIFARLGADWFRYDAETGRFARAEVMPRDAFVSERIAKMWATKYAGKDAGNLHHQGYVWLTLRGHHVMAHRYALYLKNGRWPAVTDHINGDKADNRLINLREVDQSTNRMNMRRRNDNTSGVTGVHYRNERGWLAAICVRGRRVNLGQFETKEQAVAARLSAQAELGFGPNHGAP